MFWRSTAIASAAMLLSIFLYHNADARCSCLDTPDEAARKAQEEAAMRRLPSQAKLELARQFALQQLPEDAGQYYLQAAQDAEAEVKQQADSPSVATHAMEVEREGASFFNGTGNAAQSASLHEQALQHALLLDKVDDRQVEFRSLAQAFESAGNHTKAAEYYRKLADVLAASRGRYHSETLEAMRSYKRNLDRH